MGGMDEAWVEQALASSPVKKGAKDEIMPGGSRQGKGEE